MKCQNCGEADSTIHFKEVVDGNLREIHLCEPCAAEKGFRLVIEHNKLSIAAQFIWMAENLYPESAAKVGSVQCSACGLRYSQFTRLGRLGCPDCYQAFHTQMQQILRRVHGATVHKGRLPGTESPPVTLAPPAASKPGKPTAGSLRRELARAIEREDFEDAARLRDALRRLEREPGNGES